MVTWKCDWGKGRLKSGRHKRDGVLGEEGCRWTMVWVVPKGSESIWTHFLWDLLSVGRSRRCFRGESTPHSTNRQIPFNSFQLSSLFVSFVYFLNLTFHSTPTRPSTRWGTLPIYLFSTSPIECGVGACTSRDMFRTVRKARLTITMCSLIHLCLLFYLVKQVFFFFFPPLSLALVKSDLSGYVALAHGISMYIYGTPPPHCITNQFVFHISV